MRTRVAICVLAACLPAGAEPLTLQAALDRAGSEDPNRARVLLEGERAGIIAHRATAGLLPSLQIGFQLQRNTKAVEICNRDPDTGDESCRVITPLIQPRGTLNARLRLFSGADIPDALAAWTEYESARLDAVEAELERSRDTITEFLAAAEARDLVEAQRVSRDWAEENLRVAELRAANEEGLQLDVEVARAEQLRVEASLATAEGALAAANAALAVRLGLSPEAALEPGCVEGCVPEPPSTEPELRPRLRARALDVEAAGTRGIGGWLNMLPTLELVGDARLSEPTLFNPDPIWWTAQLVASWNLFNGTADYAELRRRDLERRGAALDREIARREVTRERVQARALLNAAELSARAEAARAAAAARALAQVEARYRQGLASALDVADAARQRSEADAAAVRARFSYERAKLAAWRARGAVPGSADGEGSLDG